MRGVGCILRKGIKAIRYIRKGGDVRARVAGVMGRRNGTLRQFDRSDGVAAGAPHDGQRWSGSLD
jgi:hypothetical protein